EAALVTGEKLAALSSVVAGLEYPQADFAAAWKRVLFIQFHDSMAGTALPEHYDVAREAHGRALDIANQAMYRAAEKISWQVPALDPESEYLVVFNPHAWEAKLNVEYDVGWGFDYKTGAQTNSVLEDEDGKSISHQWIQATTVVDDRMRVLFQAPVPAFGYRQFRLRTAQPAPPAVSAVHATARELE